MFMLLLLLLILLLLVFDEDRCFLDDGFMMQLIYDGIAYLYFVAVTTIKTAMNDDGTSIRFDYWIGNLVYL